MLHIKTQQLPLSHFNSQVTPAMDPYSASAEDLETMTCFLVFQEIDDFPRNTRQPVKEQRVRGHTTSI